MTLIQFIDSFYMALAPFIGMCLIYKALSPKKSAKFAALIFSVVIFCTFFSFSASDILSFLIPAKMVRQQIFIFIMYLCFILYSFIFFNSSFKDKAVATILYLISSVASELLLMLVLFSIGDEAIDDTHSNLALRLFINNAYLLIFSLFGTIVFYFFRKHKARIPWQITVSSISLFISSISLMMTTINNRSNDFNSFRYRAVLSILCIFIIIGSLYIMGKYMNRQEIFKQKFLWIKHMQEVDIEHLKSLEEKSEEIRHIQHDFKDNLLVLKFLIENGDKESLEKAKSLISELNQKTADSKITFYTNNLIVNAVLCAKIQEAKELGVIIDTDVRIPKVIENIDDLDINVLIINLLKNAIEACQKLSKPEDRIVEFKMAVKNNFLIFKTVNSFDRIMFDNKGKLKTTKEDKENHGIGMTIIKNIAQKYNGVQSNEIKDDKFINIVSLQF